MDYTNALRHGDVLFHPVAKLPKGATLLHKGLDYTVALGEYTGHSHTLVAEKPVEVFGWNGERFLRIKAGAKIKHQEHKQLEVQPGIYKIGLEKEFDYFQEKISEVRD